MALISGTWHQKWLMGTSVAGRGAGQPGEEALISFMGRGTCPAQEMNVAAEVHGADPERVTCER